MTKETVMTASRRLSRRGVLGGLVGLGALGVAGCGLQGANQFVPKAEAGTIKPEPSLDGVRLVVGSKDFTEQLILGKLAAILLKVAGADVRDQTGIAGSVAAREALVNGEIDLYWEYTGTGWITYLRQKGGSADPRKFWSQVRDLDREKTGVEWLSPAPLNNSYALAVPQKKAEELGISKLSDLGGIPSSERTYCMNSEFRSRDDGFEPLLKKYGLPLEEGNVKTMDIGIVANTAAKGGTCNIALVTTSEGRIKTLDLKVLTDDRHYFPLYNAAMTVRGEVLKQHPAIADIFAKVSPKLTTATLQDLNTKVDTDGLDPGTVALDWLRAEGFVN